MGELGIDLGTVSTVVCDPQGGVLVQEPSAMATSVDGRRRRRLATIGRPALDLVDRADPRVKVVHPLLGGVVTDLETSRSFLRAVLRRADGYGTSLRRARAVIGVPVGATQLERRALVEAAEEARIADPVLVAEPVAGALGCGVDPTDSRMHMVVDVGGGTAEAVAFCFGEVAVYRSLRTAAEDMTVAVRNHLLQRHGIEVGEAQAEQLKLAASRGDGSLEVRGREVPDGSERAVDLSRDEVLEAIRPVLDWIVAAVVGCVRELPTPCVADILDEGVLALGGGALSPGFTDLLADALGVPVRVAERPLTCVAEGTARCIDDRRLLEACAV